MMFHSDVKHQRKLVRGLKKKSLWSKSLEEVVEKLVDIVIFIHQEILEAFGDGGLMRVGKEPAKKRERLGVAGLALHYANLITKIDNIALRPTSLPPGSRDALYNALPPAVKTALRSRLQAPDMKKKLTVAQIKGEMEKTLEWLVPVATDTTKYVKRVFLCTQTAKIHSSCSANSNFAYLNKFCFFCWHTGAQSTSRIWMGWRVGKQRKRASREEGRNQEQLHQFADALPCRQNQNGLSNPRTRGIPSSSHHPRETQRVEGSASKITHAQRPRPAH
nr:uncharacterized protein LOC109153034 [Ipomoea batatas]